VAAARVGKRSRGRRRVNVVVDVSVARRREGCIFIDILDSFSNVRYDVLILPYLRKIIGCVS
jgi:hypothetical protein